MKIELRPLVDQVVVITGASSGIGLVTARRAAERGAQVMLIARSDDTLREIVGDINANGGNADYAVADVGDVAAVAAAVATTLERFGRIDTWVNAAGSAIYGKLLDVPEDEHRQLFRTNYFGVVNCSTAAVPHLRHGGALITVASIASDLPSPMMGVYAASKHAVKAWVEVLRMELGEEERPISVSLVKPSGIDTPIAQHAVNHGPGEAQVPPPVYDPIVVANAILHCAEHQTPDVTVGGVGRAQVLFADHFKGVSEKLAPIAARTFFDPTKAQPYSSNLFQGVDAGRERSGESVGRRFSTYTTAALHPRTTASIGVGLLAGAAALLLMRRSNTR